MSTIRLTHNPPLPTIRVQPSLNDRNLRLYDRNLQL